MKRNACRTRRHPVAPRVPEFAVLPDNFADTFDDRVSESLVDYEDEREAVDIVVPAISRTMN